MSKKVKYPVYKVVFYSIVKCKCCGTLEKTMRTWSFFDSEKSFFNAMSILKSPDHILVSFDI